MGRVSAAKLYPPLTPSERSWMDRRDSSPVLSVLTIRVRNALSRLNVSPPMGSVGTPGTVW